MKHFTITIGREFGCNAREIGRQTAAALGVKFYDKELVTLAAKEGGVEKLTFFAPRTSRHNGQFSDRVWIWNFRNVLFSKSG